MLILTVNQAKFMEQQVFSYNLGLMDRVLPHAINSHSLVLLIPNCTQNHAFTKICCINTF